jgi:hypothetical protein
MRRRLSVVLAMAVMMLVGGGKCGIRRTARRGVQGRSGQSERQLYRYRLIGRHPQRAGVDARPRRRPLAWRERCGGQGRSG